MLFGPPRGGKSHLASAIGLALVENGWKVLFTRTTDLVQKLQLARRELGLEAAIAKLDRFHLLILGDLAYVTKDQAKTSVLFELIIARYERRSMLITAYQPFGEWGKVFPDPAMTLAAIDRLVHHATIFSRASAGAKLSNENAGLHGLRHMQPPPISPLRRAATINSTNHLRATIKGREHQLRTPAGFPFWRTRNRLCNGMKFTKPSLSLADQISRIEDRGMAVPDHALAAHCLQHISYYRLRAYWLPFETVAPADGEHQFKAGTCFDDVMALYVFDRRLRLLIMDAIERVEVSLRGCWAHHLAMKYGAHGYLDPTLYQRPDRYAQSFTTLIGEVAKSKDTFIVHYKTKYDDPEHPPIWMTAAIISLGQLSMWLSNLKHRLDRQAIAKPFWVDEKILVSLAHHLTYVRNICAHHGRLWNKQVTVKMMVPNSPASLKLAMNPASQGRVYNTLAVLGYLMGIVAPGNHWREHVVELMASCALADQSAMGFPENWQNFPAWTPTVAP